MAESPHYKELLQLSNEFEVQYLIVGGFALMKYREPRYAKGLDVWVHNSAENSRRVVRALQKFGAPLEHDGITAETFTDRQVVYQIGVASVRIDILTGITLSSFPMLGKGKWQAPFLEFRCISFLSMISWLTKGPWAGATI